MTGASSEDGVLPSSRPVERSIRILEIGRIPILKEDLPAQTRWLRTGPFLTQGDDQRGGESLNWRVLLDVTRRLRRGEYDLVVVPAVDLKYPWDGRLIKKLARRMIGWLSTLRVSVWLIARILRLEQTTVVIMDLADTPALSYETCRVVPPFLCYFKRELFPELTLLQTDAAARAANAKVLPISLFVPEADPDFRPVAEKTADVFFSGFVHAQVRHQGMETLRRLEKTGLRVDVPANPLKYEDYLRRMSAAWLVWSPSGYGWDCYRHYEACFAGTVPVIDRPSASRQRTLEPGVHCLFYDPAVPDDLERTIHTALANPERLRAMAACAREYVTGRYTRKGVAQYARAQIAQRLVMDGRASPLAQWRRQVPAEPSG